MKTIYYFTLANLKMALRNRASFMWSLFFPLILMVVFGIFTATTSEALRVSVVSPPSASSFVASHLNLIKDIHDIHVYRSYNLTKDIHRLDNGGLDLVVNIVQMVINKKVQYQMTFYMNQGLQTYPYVEYLVEQIKFAFLKNLNNINNKLISFYVNSGRSPADYNYISYLTPGVIAFSVMNGVLFAVIIILITYKEENILSRIFITPLTKFQFLVSIIINRLILALMQVAILMFVALYIYHVRPVGNLFSLMIIITLGALVFIALAMFLSSVVNKVETAMPLANFITLPMLFLSGLFFPLSSLPFIIRQIAQYFPLTYFIDALRNIYINGASLLTVKYDILAMVAWIVIFFILNTIFLRLD
jgi:ABC-2 type transport system permease protein